MTEPVSRKHITRVTIGFGDCDPAGIVFFPNFSRWMDMASLHFFMAGGIPPWSELARTHNIVGTPLLEIATKFISAATYPEELEIHTTIDQWHNKAFTHKHVVMRGDTLICEGTETRIFVMRQPDGTLKGIAVPDFIRQACQIPA
jgi:4-hydroxybenzoyl-CoA thioesterase